MQVLHLRAVFGGFEEGKTRRLFIRYRQVEAVAEFDQRGLVELFLAVRGHLALARRAHAVALLGVGQDHHGLAGVGRGRLVGRVDLDQVMAAAFEPVDLLVGHALRQPGEFLVLAEEGVAVEAAILGGEGLHLAVHRVGEGTRQCSGGVAGEQAVPVAAPDQLDHLPAGATKELLEFIDDAAVATHRAVQALQVAVHHPDQVVQFLARGQRERAHALGFVHLAITEHAPDLARRAVEQLAVGQVAHEARMVDRADRADAHRAGGELPEVGHEPGVRVAGEAACALGRGADLLAVVGQVSLAQPPFQIGPRIDAGRAVRLEKHQIATMALVAGMEEVVETDLEQVCRAGVTGNVTAEFAVRGIGPGHHGQRVPAHQRAQPLLDGQIAGEGRLALHRDAVHIGRDQFGRPTHAGAARHDGEFIQDEACARRALCVQQGLEGRPPLGGFGGIAISVRCWQEMGNAVIGHGGLLRVTVRKMGRNLVLNNLDGAVLTA